MPTADNGPPLHSDGKRDRRYSIHPAFCGYSKRRFVVRFCDEYVGNARTRAQANTIARAHARQRRRAISAGN